MKFLMGYAALPPEGKRTLNRAGCLVLILLISLVSCVGQAVNEVINPTPEPTESSAPMWPDAPPVTESPSSIPGAVSSAKPKTSPTKSAKPYVPALVYNTVSTASCSDVGCLTVAVQANQTCKTITVSADVYDENDEWIDTVEQSFRGMAKGSNRKFTLTDSEYEDWQLELSDVLCG
jgi:Na+-transporting methylmalonyl-CoA/oxaloacetate decarboxylase gamma subunit